MSLHSEIAKRRTFAIISHPDAGKTTMTEKLLLWGQAIQRAGEVKSRKTDKHATSDWMSMEQERGISITTSVMQFPYADNMVNLLDTPGHADFSEDTYRTLTAVDSALMVIDGAKGVEERTIKLMEVCRMRDTPIISFVNKLDREIRDPLSLLDEIENVLKIQCVPMTWPIGTGQHFVGVYNISEDKTYFYQKGHGTEIVEIESRDGYDYPDVRERIGEIAFREFEESLELAKMAHEDWDVDEFLTGKQTPVLFGTALGNFGINMVLDVLTQYAPAPKDHDTVERTVKADEEKFSGFVFKIQANMDPRHRDRIAFVRIVSGAFEEGMDVKVTRTDKKIKLNNTTRFMADSRGNVEKAVAGDIIGLYDTGNYQIGDTLVGGKQKYSFQELPQFTPEIFMKVSAKNVMKQKHFHKGIEQLVQEGAIQYYKTLHTNQIILGAVGQLQFEVFEHRMNNEYNVDVVMEPVGRKIARWIENEDDIKDNMNTSRSILVKDRYDNYVFLFENEFATRWFEEKFSDIKLYSLL